jgi:hypothetical protein
MLKSSSLCLYSSNLGIFWLKIEEFWPFEEISIFSNSGYLELRLEKRGDEILKKSSPRKLLSQLQPNFAEMILGWPPSKLVSRVGLSDTILKRTHPGTIPARFGLVWFSGFRGEDLNVILYQNMPNLHNRYISAERKNSKWPKLLYFKPECAQI